MTGGPNLIFFDASVMIAAARSPSGGSATAMDACSGRYYRAALSLEVIEECRRNIARKFTATESVRFYQQVARLEPVMAPEASRSQIALCSDLVAPKDVHVLASALACEARCLLTLDRRHLLTPAMQSAGLPVKVMTPGDFLRDVAAGA